MKSEFDPPSWVARWAVVVYSTAIMTLSVLNTNAAAALNRRSVGGFRADYLAHVVMFLPFVMLYRWRWVLRNHTKAWLPAALASGALLAASSEAIQWLLPWRVFNPMDLIANVAGVGVGVLIVLKKVVSSP
jgi:glycopeptide antibiotics resistance protein